MSFCEVVSCFDFLDKNSVSFLHTTTYLPNMTYSSKIHLCYEHDQDCDDILAYTYNNALWTLWKQKIAFMEQIKDDLSAWGYFTEQNTIYWDYFQTHVPQSFGDVASYEVATVKYIWIHESEIDEFQEIFLKNLTEKCIFVWKFEDSRSLELRTQFFQEIYEIEMKLREIISYIFFNRYYSDEWFLQDLDVSIVNIKKSLKSKTFENDFFLLSFTSYKDLLKLRDLTEKEKIQILEKSNSFKEYKEKILSRGITEKPFQDFLWGIEEDLRKIERIRNSLMHNRFFSQSERESYTKFRISILNKIETFHAQHINSEFWNELGLIINKEYECLGDLPNFSKWKKYKLQDIVCGDAVFIWDDGNPVVFFSKDFDQEWRWV